MGLYPIRTVAQMTGINPITLRAWERRYGLIQPMRTDKGHRLYSLREIETIRHITHLLEQGMSIGQVARVLGRELPTPSLQEDAAPPSPRHTTGAFADAYRAALTKGDWTMLERLEIDGLAMASPDVLISSFLLPILDALHAERGQSTVADAHYHLLKLRLLPLLAMRLRSLARPDRQPHLALASLPPERDLFELWRTAYTLQREGFEVRMLGSGMPANTIIQAARMHGCQRLVLQLERKPPAAVFGTQLALFKDSGLKIVALTPQRDSFFEELAGLGLFAQVLTLHEASSGLRPWLDQEHEP